ncbi:MAG: exodeoxyribonuclease VII large subunit [Clostridia bacterium]|nr:exodeoxyribonuclease VII large subunit [Clostridia bacterium]
MSDNYRENPDLFGSPGRFARKTLRVSDVNNYIKSLLMYDSNLSGIYVEGEISNFKRYPSGHAYFSLKDQSSVLKCVMFANQFRKVDFPPSDGLKVVAFGSVNVYERDGVYQLYVDSMHPDGIGALYEKYELLKKKLAAEGLFNDDRKRNPPLLPRAVAAVTSSAGAVIRDIMNVAGRRFPGMPILLYPAQVQGAEAPADLIKALRKVQSDGKADVIIIGRGGGSIEDLWAFNDEALAREIYACSIPVISAVGHETDYTICDYVADLRAPTPSAAAELAVPVYDGLMYEIDQFSLKLNSLAGTVYALKKRELDRVNAGLGANALRSMIDAKYRLLEKDASNLNAIVRSQIGIGTARLDRLESELKAYSYENPLKRGYALVKDSDGKIIKTAEEFRKKGRGELVMNDGSVEIAPAEA